MELNALSAISPIDGRYRAQLAPIAPYFSEFGLIRYRVKMEVEYFLFLAKCCARFTNPLPRQTRST